MGLYKDSLISEGEKKKIQVMQRQSLTTSQQHTDAQAGYEQ